MLRAKINSYNKENNKTTMVLLFSFVFLFSLSINLFANTRTTVTFHDNCKKESTIQKVSPSINYDADSIFSNDDIEIENTCITTYKTFVYLPINSIDNQSLFLKDCQNRMQFHLPLFLQYQDIRL